MPIALRGWLQSQLGVSADDVYDSPTLLRLKDLADLPADRPDLRYPEHRPVVHPRLRTLSTDPSAFFAELKRGDLLLHHPYVGFDSSVLRFLKAAAVDPDVLAIKLTIYRTSKDSPIVRALVDAARRGKQVAVLVEVTARFDEAPNIAWGKYLENEGVHVAYGVERLKTHVKLALVVRQEPDRLRRYAHVGTGNYHPVTAHLYEDVGVLTADADVCDDVAAVFNALTGMTPYGERKRMLLAPDAMRSRFIELVEREAQHAAAGRPCGVDAKMNQLQDAEMIEALYAASAAGVPVRLIVRGLCCLRPGVPGLSERITVSSVVGRFLEHSRIFRFTNGGDPIHFLGSADWMKRNLSRRVETALHVTDDRLKAQLDDILAVYANDNASAWDMGPDGTYHRRRPAPEEPRRAAQDVFIERATSTT